MNSECKCVSCREDTDRIRVAIEGYCSGMEMVSGESTVLAEIIINWITFILMDENWSCFIREKVGYGFAKYFPLWRDHFPTGDVLYEVANVLCIIINNGSVVYDQETRG
ncbi:UNVERIFIED_CONTAM: hypothetical protein PYX00_003678 [Menopon gallinae]|uniref:Uncharacterized protein n=1 Tax=Menopon gallinae TaxID=328185 RepID=A0AAW2I0W4_9NEOP